MQGPDELGKLQQRRTPHPWNPFRPCTAGFQLRQRYRGGDECGCQHACADRSHGRERACIEFAEDPADTGRGDRVVELQLEHSPVEPAPRAVPLGKRQRPIRRLDGRGRVDQMGTGMGLGNDGIRRGKARRERSDDAQSEGEAAHATQKCRWTASSGRSGYAISGYSGRFSWMK